MYTRAVRRFLPGPVALFVAGLVVPIALSPLKNWDLWFHLAGGRFLLAHGFTRSDPFSVTASAGWVPHEWGFGVLSQLSLGPFGAAGPELIVAASVAACLLLFWRVVSQATPPPGLIELVIFALAAATQSFTWAQERPYHFGHALFAVALLIVQAWRRGNDRILWAVVPLGVLWVNLHGSWILSPALVGATALGAAMEAEDEAQRRRALLGFLPAIGAFAAAAISPTGPAAYLYPLTHSLLPSTQTLIEWKPLDLTMGWSWCYLALAGVALFALGNARTRSLALLVPAAGLTLAAFKAMRHAPFAAMLLAVFILEHLQAGHPLAFPDALVGAWDRLDGWIRRWIERASGAVLPFVVLAVLAVRAVLHPIPVREHLWPGRIPVAAIEKLRELPPGKVLNRFTLGGAVSYFAGEQYKVFIDPRNDPFPEAIHNDYDALMFMDPRWRDSIARYDPDYLLWTNTVPGNTLLDLLRHEGGWREYATDGDAVLWVRERAK